MRSWLVLLPLLLVACSPLPRGGPCVDHADCETPMEYMVQSNCPYGAACIDGGCYVVCPFAYHDPDPRVSMSYPVPCDADADCDCSDRGDRSLACLCVDGGCLSVEDVIR